MEPLKIFDIGMLGFIFGLQALGGIALLFTLQGCSQKGVVIDSLFYDRRPATTGIVITKPPIQVIYFGRVGEEGRLLVKDSIDQMSKIPYRSYKFNKNTTAQAGVTGVRTETDSDSNTIELKRDTKVRR